MTNEISLLMSPRLRTTGAAYWIIGIDEGDDTNPAALLPLPVASLDVEELRIRSITALSSAPLPSFEVVRVEVTGGAVLVLCISPSPGQPHAVTVNDGLRYSVRYGNKKRVPVRE